MDSSIVIALIVAVPTVLTSAVLPVIMQIITAKQRREELKLQYAREDEVAKRVREVEQATKYQTQRLEANSGKLDVIHMLVNSSMTSAMQSECDALDRSLVLMQEVVALKHAAGREPSDETIAAIASTTDRIIILKRKLAERLRDDGMANVIQDAVIDKGRETP